MKGFSPVWLLSAAAVFSAGLALPVAAQETAAPAAPSSASVAESDMAQAERKFVEGRLLLREGRAQEACASFAASQRLYSSAATLLNLGDCFEKGHVEGGFLAARRAFEVAILDVENVSDLAAREALRAEGRRRLDHVNAMIPELLLRPSSTPGARVWLDGVAEPALGVALALEPGPHHIAVQAPGRVSYVDAFGLMPGGYLEIQLPELPPEAPLARDQPLEAGRRFGNAPLWLGAASAALGAAWLFTGVSSQSYDSEYGELVTRCSEEACDESALRRLREARGAARGYAVATDYVFMPATLLTFGTAAVLWAMDGFRIRDPEPPRVGQLGAGCSPGGCVLTARARF